MQGLYVHIPFCTQKCHYCDYVIRAHPKKNETRRYLDAIQSQIKLGLPKDAPAVFDTLYFGGGTPSYLGTALGDLHDLLKANFEFTENCEVSMEANPIDVNDRNVQSWMESGVNRISLGVQSLDDKLLQEMGRDHRAKDAEKAFKSLKKFDVKNISSDLIIRLPGQTTSAVEDSLKRLIELGTDQVVVYDLNIHPKTLFGFKRAKNKLVLPDESAHEAMWQIACKRLSDAGFLQYEVASFAKKNKECRHNLVYWKNKDYLGLGPGAFSYFSKTRRVFASTVGKYLDKCKKGDWSDEEAICMTDKEVQMETFLTGLRLYEGVNLDNFPLIQDHLKNEISRLTEEGLVKEIDSNIKLTDRGKYLAESVFTQLCF